jgi:hypothetical protein
LYFNISTALALLIFSSSRLTIFCLKVTLPAKRKQCIESGIHTEDDISSAASVPAVRPPPGDETLPAEAYTPGPSVSSLDVYFGLINKIHKLSIIYICNRGSGTQNLLFKSTSPL